MLRESSPLEDIEAGTIPDSLNSRICPLVIASLLVTFIDALFFMHHTSSSVNNIRLREGGQCPDTRFVWICPHHAR